MELGKISVVLPCYNEKDNIITLIDEIHHYLNDFSHEIVVVDDNSPDGTYDLVKNKNYPFVILVKRLKDPSLGKSIRVGVESSSGDVVVLMDSDFNHRPEELPALLNGLQYFNCVIASRFVYGGFMSNKYRYIASWLFNVFVRVVTRNFITDSLYGYVAIRRGDLFKVDFDKVFYGYGDYCIRLLYYLQRNRLAMLQIPSVLGVRRGGAGNKHFVRTFILYTKETLKLVFKKKRKGQVMLYKTGS